MISRLFKSQAKVQEAKNQTEKFLIHFPEGDFWRFFVERSRYEHGHIIYRLLYCAFNGVRWRVANSLAIGEIQDALKDKTVQHVYEITRNNQHERVARFFAGIFKQQEMRHLKVSDFLKKQRGWVGFEQKEPGYLLGVTNGLKFIFESLAKKDDLSLAFIKELHRISTQGVSRMLRQQPGQFRKGSIFWRLDVHMDSWAGIVENIDYARRVEKSKGVSGLQVILCFKDEEKVVIDTFANIKSNDVALKIKQALLSDGYVRYQAYEGPHVNTEEFLSRICTEQIANLKRALLEAKNKKDKLTAIFVFLKFTVLRHVFTDGVGRSFSMLLILYLLMKENLTPVILTDSNYIPGHSVSEPVDEYLRAEAEMKRVLDDHTYIASHKFATPNVKTSDVLEGLEDHEKKHYADCLAVFKAAKMHYISSINNETQFKEVVDAKEKVCR